MATFIDEESGRVFDFTAWARGAKKQLEEQNLNYAKLSAILEGLVAAERTAKAEPAPAEASQPAAAAEPSPAPEPASFEEGLRQVRAELDARWDSAQRIQDPDVREQVLASIRDLANQADRAEAERAVRLYRKGQKS